MKPIFWLAVALGACSACGDSSTPGNDAGADVSNNNSDGPTTSPKLKFTTTVVDDQNAGLQAKIAAGGGKVAIVYYRETAEEVMVDCPATATGPGGVRPRQQSIIYYAQWDGASWSTPVRVDNTIGPTFGLGLAIDDSGQPYVGYAGGAVNKDECNSGDAMLITSTDNGVSFANPTTVDPAHDVGDTVGHWPSVAIDPNGTPQVVYRDTRFGFYTGDGDLRSTVLLGDNSPVLSGMGYGQYNKLIYTNTGDPVVLTGRRVQNGDVVIAQRVSGNWDSIKLLNFAPAAYPDIATDGNGNFLVAYYAAGQRALEIRESTSPLSGWSAAEQVDVSSTEHGSYSSAAYDSQGNPAISYRRCSKVSSSSCEPDEDALMLAYRVSGTWQVFKVDDGDDNPCGEYTGLAFDSNDNPMIVYRCSRFDNATQAFVPMVKVARGAWQ